MKHQNTKSTFIVMLCVGAITSTVGMLVPGSANANNRPDPELGSITILPSGGAIITPRVVRKCFRDASQQQKDIARKDKGVKKKELELKNARKAVKTSDDRAKVRGMKKGLRIAKSQLNTDIQLHKNKKKECDIYNAQLNGN